MKGPKCKISTNLILLLLDFWHFPFARGGCNPLIPPPGSATVWIDLILLMCAFGGIFCLIESSHSCNYLWRHLWIKLNIVSLGQISAGPVLLVHVNILLQPLLKWPNVVDFSNLRYAKAWSEAKYALRRWRQRYPRVWQNGAYHVGLFWKCHDFFMICLVTLLLRSLRNSWRLIKCLKMKFFMVARDDCKFKIIITFLIKYKFHA